MRIFVRRNQLVPGERVRFDTASENVSVVVTAEGVTVSGDDQVSGGRRRLMSEDAGTGSGLVKSSEEDVLSGKIPMSQRPEIAIGQPCKVKEHRCAGSGSVQCFNLGGQFDTKNTWLKLSILGMM